MKALNYFRDALKQYDQPGWEYVIPSFRNVLHNVKNAHKFILPNLGRIIDNDLHGIPDTVRLPYQSIILEYTAIGNSSKESFAEKLFGENTISHPKRIAIAEQIDDEISIHCISFSDEMKKWIYMPYTALLSIERRSADDLYKLKEFIDPALQASATDKQSGFVVTFKPLDGIEDKLDNWKVSAAADLHDEIRAVLELIQALACRNVSAKSIGITPHPPSKNKKKAYPYDEYHILTVDTSPRDSSGSEVSHIGERRAPREHLRMGHIRRYKTGLCIWIQPAVINSGSAGKVIKNYAVK